MEQEGMRSLQSPGSLFTVAACAWASHSGGLRGLVVRRYLLYFSVGLYVATWQVLSILY